ncbi:MAG TPA: hypothetical protein VHI71_06460 [Actinomycetota bacterium]|nr:hypothetical protein [Actinomycetota bacterium]
MGLPPRRRFVRPVVLDFYGSWERVAIGFDVPVNNRAGRGVPE